MNNKLNTAPVATEQAQAVAAALRAILADACDSESETNVSAELYRRGFEALAASPEAAPAAMEGNSALMRFYGVDSPDALIAAQARHIEKLQSKLQPAPSFAPQRVREG